jgi:hypothetical protein
MAWAGWLNPSTTWKGVSPRALRRDSAIWLVWSLSWLFVWALLGNLMFRFKVLPDDSVLLLLAFFGAMVFWLVSGLFALARFTLSFLLK